jgi:hypothetical protein
LTLTWHLEGETALAANFRQGNRVPLPFDLFQLPVRSVTSHLIMRKGKIKILQLF